MSQTKIIFLDHTPFCGGAQYVLAAHIRYLDKGKFDPVVICSQRTPELIDLYKKSGARVYPVTFGQLKTKSLSSILSLWQSYQEIKKSCSSLQPDILVTNTVRAHIVGTLVALRLNLPLIWIIRDYTFSKPLFKLLQMLAKKILFVSRDLIKFYGLENSAKTETIFVGSDFDQELKKVKSADIEKLKKQLGLKDKTLVIGYVGRLVGWKGAQVLVKAMVKVVERFPAAKAVIVGGGSGQEGNNEKEIKDLVTKLKLSDNVYLCGSKPFGEVPLYYKIFNIFVHPSIEPEPFATVVVNAMMVPLPVIGTNIGGTPEIIKNNENGLLTAPNDSEELAEAIIRLVNDKELRDRLSKAAFNRVSETLTEKNVTAKMELIYTHIIRICNF